MLPNCSLTASLMFWLNEWEPNVPKHYDNQSATTNGSQYLIRRFDSFSYSQFDDNGEAEVAFGKKRPK